MLEQVWLLSYGSLDWCENPVLCFPRWSARAGQRGGMEVREALQRWRKLPVASILEPYIPNGSETQRHTHQTSTRGPYVGPPPHGHCTEPLRFFLPTVKPTRGQTNAPVSWALLALAWPPGTNEVLTLGQFTIGDSTGGLMSPTTSCWDLERSQTPPPGSGDWHQEHLRVPLVVLPSSAGGRGSPRTPKNDIIPKWICKLRLNARQS